MNTHRSVPPEEVEVPSYLACALLRQHSSRLIENIRVLIIASTFPSTEKKIFRESKRRRVKTLQMRSREYMNKSRKVRVEVDVGRKGAT